MVMAKVIVIKDNQIIEAFKGMTLLGSIKEAFELTGRSYSKELLEMLTNETISKLTLIGTELYTEDIYHATIDTLDENGYDDEAISYKEQHQKDK